MNATAKFRFEQTAPVFLDKAATVALACKVLAGPLEGEQSILYAEIDLGAIPAQKWLFDSAGHYNRPDVFGFSVRRHDR